MKLSTLLVVLFVSTVSASLLPVELGGTFPVGAVKQALQREKLKVDHDTSGVAKGAFRPLEELKNWAKYTREYKPVLLVTARPKLRETFGSALAQQPAPALRFISSRFRWGRTWPPPTTTNRPERLRLLRERRSCGTSSRQRHRFEP